MDSAHGRHEMPLPGAGGAVDKTFDNGSGIQQLSRADETSLKFGRLDNTNRGPVVNHTQDTHGEVRQPPPKEVDLAKDDASRNNVHRAPKQSLEDIEKSMKLLQAKKFGRIGIQPQGQVEAEIREMDALKKARQDLLKQKGDGSLEKEGRQPKQPDDTQQSDRQATYPNARKSKDVGPPEYKGHESQHASTHPAQTMAMNGSDTGRDPVQPGTSGFSQQETNRLHEEGKQQAQSQFHPLESHDHANSVNNQEGNPAGKLGNEKDAASDGSKPNNGNTENAYHQQRMPSDGSKSEQKQGASNSLNAQNDKYSMQPVSHEAISDPDSNGRENHDMPYKESNQHHTQHHEREHECEHDYQHDNEHSFTLHNEQDNTDHDGHFEHHNHDTEAANDENNAHHNHDHQQEHHFEDHDHEYEGHGEHFDSHHEYEHEDHHEYEEYEHEKHHEHDLNAEHEEEEHDGHEDLEDDHHDCGHEDHEEHHEYDDEHSSSSSFSFCT